MANERVGQAVHIRKGEQTRAAILDVALDVASRDGLEGVTIGILADRLDMSKSGVFSHFGSRDELLIEVLKEYEARFLADILKPALVLPRGLSRLRAILDNWFTKLGQETENGCLYISGAVEYDDRPGVVRDELVGLMLAWEEQLRRAIRYCVESGEFHENTPIDLMIFELYGLTLGFHQSVRLMKRDNAMDMVKQILERILNQYLRTA